MPHIVLALIALCLGIWGLVTYWGYTVDVLVAIFPLLLLFVGIIALLAGIKNLGMKTNLVRVKKKPEANDPITKKKDD